MGEAGGKEGVLKINAQRTIQCELFGNPCTAAGPKARAVFIPAPVYGTANLNFWLALERCVAARSRAAGKPGPAVGKISWPTYKWQANSVRPMPIYIKVKEAGSGTI